MPTASPKSKISRLECVQREEGEVPLTPSSPLASASSTEPVINLIFRYKQVHTVYTKVRLTVSVEGTEPIVGHKSSNSPLEKVWWFSYHPMTVSHISYFTYILTISSPFTNGTIIPSSDQTSQVICSPVLYPKFHNSNNNKKEMPAIKLILSFWRQNKRLSYWHDDIFCSWLSIAMSVT